MFYYFCGLHQIVLFDGLVGPAVGFCSLKKLTSGLHHSPPFFSPSTSLSPSPFCFPSFTTPPFPLPPSSVSPCTLASFWDLLRMWSINLSLTLRTQQSNKSSNSSGTYCSGSNTTFSCLTSLMYSLSQGGHSLWLIVAAQTLNLTEWES